MEELLQSSLYLVGSTLAILFVLLHVYIYARRNFSPARFIPGENGNFYIGMLKEVAKVEDHIANLQLRWLKKHPDSSLIRYNFVLGEIKVIVTDPDIIKHVLITNGSNYNKNLPSYHMVKKYFLGNGLVALDGAAHAHHRGLINDAFSYKYLKNFVGVFSEQTKKLTDFWDAKEDGALVNVQYDLLSVGLSIIGLTSFGFDFDTLSKKEDRDSNARDLAKKFLWSIKTRPSILGIIFPIFNSLPVPTNTMRIKRRDDLNYGVEKVIRAKREYLKNADQETLGKPRDLLEIIINLKDENGQTLSTSDLIDEAKTFILAGFETTASAMNFTLYLLALHPEHADIIKNEVDQVLGDKELVEPEDIEKFKYLGMVIKEAMRLFPPVPAVSRHCVEGDVLGGYKIPKGTAVNVVPYVMHHHPKYWEEPEKFNPLRWTPEEVAKRHPYLYFPFLLGARNCIGQKFGMMEVKAVLAMIIRKYEFTVPPGWKMTPKSFITLQSTPQLQMYIRHRNK